MKFLPPTLAALLLAWLHAASAAEGLSLSTDSEAWPAWRARLSLTTLSGTRLPFGDGAAYGGLQRGSLLGDYYFSRSLSGVGSASGALRATSGLLFGPRSASLGESLMPARSTQPFSLSLQAQALAPAADAAATLPYLGIGYTGLSAKGGWGFSADFGLLADSPARGGRALLGSQGLDSGLRELRLSPLLQLGVSYAF